MKTKILFLAGVMLSLVALAEPTKRTVALVVQNHAAPGAKIAMTALTDALTAKLSGRGLEVINPDDAVGSNANRTVVGEPLPELSAFELGRQLGAEGVVTASVLELTDTPIGNPTRFHTFTIRLAFNLADVTTGAAVCGETLKVTSATYTDFEARTKRPAILNDLVFSAADKCAQRLEEKSKAWKSPRVTTPPSNSPSPIVVEPPDGMTSPRVRPRPPERVLTIHALDASAQKLVKEMLASRQFRLNYTAATNCLAEAGRDRLPIAVMGGLVDLTKVEANSELVDACNASVRVLLFKSDLFAVKDDSVIAGLTKRILAAGNSPLEDGSVMDALKKHGSPDFFVVGDLRKFDSTYRFRLSLHDLATGKVLWEGVDDILK